MSLCGLIVNICSHIGATECYITALGSFMSLAIMRLTIFVTLGTAEWFILSVGVFMSLQMA